MTTTAHRHTQLGTVHFTDACRQLQRENPDPTSVWVEHEGEPKEVTVAMLYPNPLVEGRVNCSNCRFYERKPTRKEPRTQDLLGRCMHRFQAENSPDLAAQPFNQYATNGSNCPCWRAIPVSDAETRLAAITEHLACKAAGFAGVLPNGMVVDRRDKPDAIPMAKNDLLGIPEPARCERVQCRSLRLVWSHFPGEPSQLECDECGKLQRQPR